MEHKRYTIKKDENPLEKMARAIRAYQLANSGKKPKAIFISEAGKRVLAPKQRDEALWTEYAKAALTGFVSTKEWGDGIDAEDTACFVKGYASAMLAAHKKRWGHE